MSYLKTTIIGGYTTEQPNPYSREALGRDLTNEESSLCIEWMDKYYVTTTRRGHWSAEACIRIAEKRGLCNATFTHITSDMSGKGRGSRDAKWDIVDGRAVQVAGFQNVDDSKDVHELYDEMSA